MSLLEVIIIVGVSLAILLLIASILFIGLFIVNNSRLKKIKNKQAKKKSKKRKKMMNDIQKKKKLYFILSFVSFLLFLLFSGGSYYAKYYQSSNLAASDSDNIVYGFYLLDELESQINNIDDSEKKGANLHELGVSLASFAAKKGSDQATKEGQVLLNRYYTRVGQIGINLGSENLNQFKTSEEKQKEYIEEIKQAKTLQKEVTNYYKINQTSLKNKE